MYTNADQLRNKMDELKMRSENYMPEIIAITEVKPKRSHLKINSAEYVLNDSKFDMFEKNLENDIGRGIVMHIDKRLNAKPVEVETAFEECLLAKVDLNNNDKLLICVVYRSESGTEENNNKLNKLINETCTQGYSHLLIMGDINYPDIDWENWFTPGELSREQLFLKTLQKNFLYQHVDKPTRFRGTDTPNVLDLIITNNDNVSQLEYQSQLGKSDHSVLTFQYNCYAILKDEYIQKVYYDKADFEAIKAELDEVKWEEILNNCKDNNERWDIFKTKILLSHNKHVPIRKYRKGKSKKGRFPIDEETKALISRKHALSRKAAQNNTDENRRQYNKVRNKVTAVVKKIKRDFERDLAKKVKKKSKEVFRYINSKASKKVGIGEIHIDPSDNKSELTDENEKKAEVFAKYFRSVHTVEPDGEIPLLPPKDVEHIMGPLTITNDMVKKGLLKLKVDKAPGPDGLHPRFLRELADQLAEPLRIIFNSTLSEHSVPDEWKRARVCAIHKKGNKKLASNYRPVSLTAIICKVMETLVRNHIIEYMKKNKLFSAKQYGFISGRSTSLQLLAVLDMWTEAMDLGYAIDAIYMDFRKAFDLVPHNRLLGKLDSYGISNEITSWIKSFLIGRLQKVTVNGKDSEWSTVTSGIPQGSVLGPLLFVIYINDLPDSVSSDAYLFADDTKIFRIVTDSADQQILQTDLDKLTEWSDTWLLEYNADKCLHLHLGKEGPSAQVPYKLSNTELKTVDNIKDIGVTIESKLKFDIHISQKAKKANQMMGLIRRTFQFLDKETFIPLYKSLVRSHLDFASSVWAPHYLKHIVQLEKVQKRATKQLPGLKKLGYPDRLRKLKMPTLAYRRLRGDLIETYKMLHEVYDPDVYKILKLRKDMAVDSTRGHSLMLFHQRGKKWMRKNFFALRVVEHWNGLPEEIVSAPDVIKFKIQLDKLYINKDIYYDDYTCLADNHTCMSDCTYCC